METNNNIHTVINGAAASAATGAKESKTFLGIEAQGAVQKTVICILLIVLAISILFIGLGTYVEFFETPEERAETHKFAEQRRAEREEAKEGMEINAEANQVADYIQENGPPKLRQFFSRSKIYMTALSFVSAKRAGTLSDAELARMGGVTGATQSALEGELGLLGY